MEINLDRPVLTQMFSPYSEVTYSPYLTSTVRGHYDNVGNVVSLHLDQRPSFLNTSRLRAGILKPKAIRIASVHPLINSNIYQGNFATHFEGIRGQAYNLVHSLECRHSPAHGVNEQVNIIYPTFPYLSSRHYGTNGHTSLLDAEHIFKHMFRGQNVYIHEASPNGSRVEESRRAADLVRMSGNASLSGSLFTQNTNYFPRELLTSKTPPKKLKPLPFKVDTKGSCASSQCRQSKGRKFCLQKQSQHLTLKTSKKRFHAPIMKTINDEIIIMKKAQQATQFSNQDETGNSLSESLTSKFSWQAETNNRMESPHSAAANKEISFTTDCLPYERRETSSPRSDRTSTEDFDKTQIMDGRVVYSKLPDFSEERKSFRCSQCRYLTDRKNNLKRHVVTMHQESSKILECCGVNFQNKAALRDHNSIFHRGGYRCQVCSRNFCRKALLRRHLTVHSGQKDFFCGICGYATSHKSNLERHQKVHVKRETISDALTKGVSIKVGVRFCSAPSTSAVALTSNRQTAPSAAARLASILPEHETIIKFSDKKDNSLLNSHQTAKDNSLLNSHQSARDQSLLNSHQIPKDNSLLNSHQTARDNSLLNSHQTTKDKSLLNSHQTTKDNSLLNSYQTTKDNSLLNSHQSARNKSLLNSHQTTKDNSLLNSHQTTEDNLLLNSHQTTNFPKSQELNNPYIRTVKDLYKNSVQNLNSIKNIKLNNQNVLEINVFDRWDLEKADISVEVAATRDNADTALNTKSIEHKRNSNCN